MHRRAFMLAFIRGMLSFCRAGRTRRCWGDGGSATALVSRAALLFRQEKLHVTSLK
jgi:hypothetical protein